MAESISDLLGRVAYLVAALAMAMLLLWLTTKLGLTWFPDAEL